MTNRKSHGRFRLVRKSTTLNDLEWSNGQFTLNSHYYELDLTVLLAGFESIFYLFTVEFVYITLCTVPKRRSAGSGVANRDPQNIGIRRKTADLP